MAFFLFILQIHEVSSSLSEPRNVRVESYNMGAVLKWEAPPNAPKDLVFTVQAEFSDDSFEPICPGTKELQCDFGHHISCLGDYKLRVRAELPQKSKWTTIEFAPEKHTVIGPPTVGLHAKGGAIEMTIKDPLLRVSTSLRVCYSEVTYVVKYWKAGHEKDVSEKLITEQRHRFWPLESGASYCFQVRVQIRAYQTKAEYTDPTCEMTPVVLAAGGEKQWPGALVSSLVAVAVLLPVMLLTAWLTHRGRRFLNPKVSLPQHFKQVPGVSSVFPTLEDASTLPEQYDTISSLYEELPYHAITCQSPYDNITRQSSYQDLNSLSSVWQAIANATGENCDEEPQYGNVVDVCLKPYRNV